MNSIFFYLSVWRKIYGKEMDAAELYEEAPVYRGIKVFDDARKAIAALGAYNKETYYIHQLPFLPQWLDKEYRFYNQKVNPYRLRCTCSDRAVKADRLANPRDIRQVCLHLYRVITRRYSFDRLTALLLENQIAHGEEKLIKREVKDAPVLFGIKNRNRLDWVNVYMQNRFDPVVYTRHAFNINEQRWSYGGGPEDNELIENLITFLFGIR